MEGRERGESKISSTTHVFMPQVGHHPHVRKDNLSPVNKLQYILTEGAMLNAASQHFRL